MKNDNSKEKILDRMMVIKGALLNKRKGVYSIIVNYFGSEIREYGPKIFAISLADKLKIEEKEINLASLRSAFSRANSAPKKHFSLTEKILEGAEDDEKDEYGFS